MTQASLTSDLDPSFGRQVPDRATVRHAAGSEAALWLFGLTAAALVLASLALLGLLIGDVMGDARLSGFVSALALVTAVVGLVAMAYVVVSAHRAGYLAILQPDASDRPAAAPPGDRPTVSSGLRVVPAVPADLAARRRREVASERAERASQARAIASAEAGRPHARPTAPPPLRALPVQAGPVVRPTAAPASGRPRPVMATSRPTSRPTAVPPYLRMSRPSVHAHARPTQLQVSVADARVSFLPSLTRSPLPPASAH